LTTNPRQYSGARRPSPEGNDPNKEILISSVTDASRRTAAPALGTFERYLTVWVALCR